jgi:uncharacterized protein YdhG (YjbR/CyaY superfamily)
MDMIDSYLGLLPLSQRVELERVRLIVKRSAPDAVESMTYGLPAFKYNGKPLIYFGGFKNHMSLFPTSGPTETLKSKLRGYKISKGTIQFTEKNPLPSALIENIVQVRLTEIDEQL